MRRKLRVLLLLLLVAASVGCAGLNPTPTATPNPLAATVTLNFPPPGAVIYASALTIAGTLADAPQQALTLQLVSADQQILAQTALTASAGAWSTEIIHGIMGNPQPITVRVIPTNASSDGIFASHEITIAPLSERPEGSFVNVLSPEEGREVGGDVLPVNGTVSGFSERRLTVELVDSNSTVIDSQTVTWEGGYPIDELPWSVELQPGETIGNAVIRITADSEVQTRLAIILTPAAG